MPAVVPSTESVKEAVQALTSYMSESLIRLTGAPSPSGQEQPAASVLEALLRDLELTPERLYVDSSSISGLPLFSCPCNPDGQRYNLLACVEPVSQSSGDGKAVLFNGHMDVVPTGPQSMWTAPPFHAYEKDGWIYGRGAGDMKAGLICALTAIKTLQTMGLQPTAKVGFNAVVDEEDTGNGTLGTIHALQNARAKAKLVDFGAVIIPEPFGETLMAAQVGVLWLTVRLTGRPAHVAYMNEGLNPIEAGIALTQALKRLQAQMNAPENRHPAFKHVEHPININLGTIEGGDWKSSVPCACTLGFRAGFYPDVSGDEALQMYSDFIRNTVAALSPDLQVEISNTGFKAPGCMYDLEHPAMRQLAASYEAVTGGLPQSLACTATTDGRHFRLMADMPVAVFGPHAENIHAIDERVSLASMVRVTQTMVHFITQYCGVARIG